MSEGEIPFNDLPLEGLSNTFFFEKPPVASSGNGISPISEHSLQFSPNCFDPLSNPVVFGNPPDGSVASVPNNYVSIGPFNPPAPQLPAEPEPASLDSLELPEIDTSAEDKTAERQGDRKQQSKSSSKKRFRPCDGCRQRKIKCVTEENQRSCMECSKRNQSCEYDQRKIFLFNNLNALSGVTKLIRSQNKANGVSKGQRTKPCDACRMKRSKCYMVEGSKTCAKCAKQNMVCTYGQSLLEVYPARGKVNLLTSSKSPGSEKERPVKDYSLLKEPTVMTSSLSLLSSKSTTIIGECSILEKKLLLFPNLAADGPALIQSPISALENGDKVIRKLNNQSYFQIVDDNEDFINLKWLQCDEIEKLVSPDSNYLILLYFRLVHPTLPIILKPAFYERYCRNYREIHPLLLASVYLLALNWWELDANEFESDTARDPFMKGKNKPDVAKLELIAIALMEDNLYETPKFSVLQAFLLLLNYSFIDTDNPFNAGSTWKIVSLMTTYAAEIGLNWLCNYWTNIPLWERKVRKLVSWCVIFNDKLYSLFEGKLSTIDLENNWIIDKLEFNDFLLDPESADILRRNELMEKNEMFRLMVEAETSHSMEISGKEAGNIDLSKDIDNKFMSKLIFIETMGLSSQISEILIKLYSLKSLKMDDFDEIYEKSVPLIENLKKWFNELPKQIKLVSNGSDQRTEDPLLLGNKDTGDYKRLGLLSNGSLNLLYYTLILLIYKRLINKYIDYLENNVPEENAVQSPVSLEVIIDKFKDLKPHIKNLLKTVIYQFLFNLNPYNLESFWFLNTRRSLIFIGIVIALLVKTIDLEMSPVLSVETPGTPSQSRRRFLSNERQELVGFYKDYHWKLTTMAPDFNHARLALKYLDSLVVLEGEGTGDSRIQGSENGRSDANTEDSVYTIKKETPGSSFSGKLEDTTI